MKRTQRGAGGLGRRIGRKIAGLALLGLAGGSAGCGLLCGPGHSATEQVASLPILPPAWSLAAAKPGPGPACGMPAAGPPVLRRGGPSTAAKWGDSAAERRAPRDEAVATGGQPGDGPRLPEAPGDRKPAGEGGQDTPKKAGEDGAYQVQKQQANPTAGLATPAIPPPTAVQPITLPGTLALAGVANPQIALAQQAEQASLALQLQARALLLPSVTAGASTDLHTGNTQSSFGLLFPVDRQNAYAGLGARTIAAESISIPGVRLYAQLGEAIYEPIIARRVVAQRQFEATATRNDILLDVALRYLALLRAEGRLAVYRQSEADFDEIVRLTEAYYRTGQGRKGDADRARAYGMLVRDDEQRAQEEVAVAAAELARFLNVDPSVRLQIAKDPIQVVQLIDPHMPLADLMRVALRSRPELGAAAARIGAAEARVSEEKARPFLPLLIASYSAGTFGGGSNSSLASSFFGLFAPRTDFDAFAVWTLQNAGLGNIAQIRRRRTEVNQAEGVRNLAIERVGQEVTDAYVVSAARLRSVDITRRQVETGVEGLNNDLVRIRAFASGREPGVPEELRPRIPERPGEIPRPRNPALRGPRPIEVLNSAGLLLEARLAFLQAIIAFDEAQFRLFVALGQPPTLAVAGDGDDAAACAAPGALPP